MTEQQINGNGINPSNGDLPDGHYEDLQPGSGNGDQMVMRTLPDVPQVSPSTILSQTSRTSELTVEDWYHMRWKKMHFFESEIQKSAEESRMAEVGLYYFTIQLQKCGSLFFDWNLLVLFITMMQYFANNTVLNI